MAEEKVMNEGVKEPVMYEVSEEAAKILSQQEMESMDLNDLAKIYNEEMIKMSDLATKVVKCTLSEDEFDRIIKAIDEVELVAQDSTILMFETINATIKELTQFKLNEPWTLRKVMLIDTMLGKKLCIKNGGVIRAWNKAFGKDIVKAGLSELAREQNYLSQLMQIIRYKEQMNVYQEMRSTGFEDEQPTEEVSIPEDAMPQD